VTQTLSELTNFVLDAYRLSPTTPFVPENTLLGQYTFLSWVRAGVGAVVTSPVAPGIRAEIQVVLPVQADGQPDDDVQQSLQVRGPGDVTGIDERQVIRRYPTPETTNAEDIFCAHIEFDRPELPWLFSPEAASGNLLAPWLVLVVLADGRWAPRAPGGPGLPAQVDTFLSELQPLDDVTRWAHAQLIGPADQGPDGTGPSLDDRLTRDYAAANLSRLLCPRRLEPDRQYLACVVPSYDAGLQTGRATGLPGTLGPAWTRAADGSDADTPITLPVYTSWRFGIGEDGDFGSLAAKLRGVPAPWQLGRRLTELSTPGGGMDPLQPTDSGRIQTIHGPLVSPNGPQADSADPTEAEAAASEDALWPTRVTEQLRAELNRPADLAGKPATTQPAPIPRPVVGPEIYARFQAAVSRVDPTRDADWFGELNLHPEHRVQAGLGTRVVQKDQEQLMQAAWAQVGEIDATNRRLRWAQLARFVGTAWHDRHITPLPFGDLLQATRGVQSRVLAASGITVSAAVSDSSLADAATQPAFRRVTRPLGGLARFVGQRPADRKAAETLVATGIQARDMQRPYVELDGVTGVTALAAKAIDPKLVQQQLGVPAGQVPAKLTQLGAALGKQPSVADVFTPDRIARAKLNTSTSLVEVAGKQLLDRLRASAPPKPVEDPMRALSAASIAGALVAIGGSFSDEARQLTQTLMQGIDAQPPPPMQQMVGFLAGARQPDWGQVGEGFATVAKDVVDVTWPGTPVLPPLTVKPDPFAAKLQPALTVTARIRGRLGVLPSWLPADWFDDLLVSPIMAAPVFTRPMYQALDDYSRDWLLPGLATFPQPDIVSVLISHAPFLEAFFAGLSHEMGRELLWRGYPTDQRGTYFRRFWNGLKDELVQDLHRFTPTPLGSHIDQTLNDRVVLLVRGELIRRYPDAIVLAMFAGDQDADGVPVFEDPSKTAVKVLAPIDFHGHLDPDLVLVGFDLTITEISQGIVPTTPDTKPGWWFVIAEHPTAPRFGLAEQNTPGSTRDSLDWGEMSLRLGSEPFYGFLNGLATKAVSDPDGSATFGADAASTAHVLLRDPVRAAFEAIAMLTPTGALTP
jgi:hypothetical protein